MWTQARYRLVASAQTFMDAYELSTSDVGHNIRRIGTVELCIKTDNKVCTLQSVHQRGSKRLGYANKALKFICDLADIHQVVIKTRLDTDDLTKWLDSLGFVEGPGRHFIRNPR